jgi:hypothetical protein
MNDELKRIWKETVVGYYPDICLESCSQANRYSSLESNRPFSPTQSLERCLYDNQLSGITSEC